MIRELLVEQGPRAVYLVNFTQRACAEQAQNLMSDRRVCTKERKKAQGGAGGRALRHALRQGAAALLHGIGLHHAGLLPKYRLLVEKLAQQGLLKVICGTDTLGVGVNIPIRTVLFTSCASSTARRPACSAVRDFQQIAGRAGRKGFDDVGYVVAQAPAHAIENIKLQQKKAEGKKNVTLQKPPTKGYVHWDARPSSACARRCPRSSSRASPSRTA
jgi:superfamily II RNA helicase